MNANTERYWADGRLMTDEEVADLAAEHIQNEYETVQSALADTYMIDDLYVVEEL